MKDFKHYFELVELDKVDEVTFEQKDFNYYFELVEIDEVTLEQQHQEFCKYVQMELDGVINEAIIPAWIKDKLNIIKAWGIALKVNLASFLKMFFNKKVFQFFSLFKWDLENMIDLLKQALNIYKKVQMAIPELIGNSKIFKKFDELVLKNLDAFLEKHPWIKQVSGVALGAFLIYVFVTASFTGHPEEDFDVSIIFDAFRGAFSLSDLFGTPAGIKMLMLFATGGVFNVGVDWFNELDKTVAIAGKTYSVSANLLVGIVKYLAEQLGFPNPLKSSPNTKKEEEPNQTPETNPTPAPT